MKARLTPERQALAAQFAGSARRIALKMAKQARAFHYADVACSAALEAATEAAATYDPSSGVPFEGFAFRRVAGEVLDALKRERRHWGARMGGLDAAGFLEDPSDALHDTDSDTAAHLDGLVDEVLLGMLLGHAGELRRAQGEAGLIAHAGYAALRGAVARLDEAAQQIVELRYGDDLGWEEVASRLGLSERTVRRHDQQLRRRLAAELRAFHGAAQGASASGGGTEEVATNLPGLVRPSEVEATNLPGLGRASEVEATNLPGLGRPSTEVTTNACGLGRASEEVANHASGLVGAG